MMKDAFSWDNIQSFILLYKAGCHLHDCIFTIFQYVFGQVVIEDVERLPQG